MFFLIEPLLRHSARYWIENLFVLALFVVAYLAFLRFNHLRTRLLLLSGMVTAGAVFFPWNQGAPTFMIYATAFLPLTLSSLPWIITLLCLDALILIGVGWRFHLSPYGWLIDAMMLFVAGISNIFPPRS